MNANLTDTDIDKLMVIFGEKVRKTRKDKGISQEQLAAMADIDRSYMGNIERGEKNITLRKAYQISDALQIDLKTLL